MAFKKLFNKNKILCPYKIKAKLERACTPLCPATFCSWAETLALLKRPAAVGSSSERQKKVTREPEVLKLCLTLSMQSMLNKQNPTKNSGWLPGAASTSGKMAAAWRAALAVVARGPVRRGVTSLRAPKSHRRGGGRVWVVAAALAGGGTLVGFGRRWSGQEGSGGVLTVVRAQVSDSHGRRRLFPVPLRERQWGARRRVELRLLPPPLALPQEEGSLRGPVRRSSRRSGPVVGRWLAQERPCLESSQERVCQSLEDGGGFKSRRM